MTISPARMAAFDVLLGIEKEWAFSSVLLPVFEATLSPQDRGLCHELVLGSLRKQIYLDRIIDLMSKGRKIDTEVRIALRLAIYQLRFLDRIPDHSAVKESVDLVHRAGKSSARPFVNAILRRLLRENVEIEFTDDADRMSVETSHPRWLLDKWKKDMGPETAHAFASANNVPPPGAFRLLDNDPELEKGVLPHARKSEFVPGCFIADTHENLFIRLAHENRIYFQDEASQMVAHSVQVAPGQRILDLCASPGGKTGIMVQNAKKRGGTVIAGDLTTRRVGLLTENCLRQGAMPDGIVQFDASEPLPLEPASFDAVLVDAPCSGTGTIRHKPELRYLVDPAGFDRLADKQLSILISASEMLRPGGELIYSTCSIEREENEQVCERFLNGARGYSPIAPRIPGNFITAEGYARTRPDRDGMDGFFVAAFRRN
jgi:16S rRNA (cytosine967-C5)-methyltransferase